MDTRWQKVLALAEEQYGLVTRAQMLDLLVTRRMIVRALEDGRLHRVAPEVFRVCGAPQTERMATAAAVFAAHGAASFGAAAALLRLDAPTPAVPIDVTVGAADRHPRIRRVEVATPSRAFHPVVLHRYGADAVSRPTVDGIDCTDAAGTLIDLAGRLGLDQLEDAFERARRLGLVSPASLARRFEMVGGKGRKGAAKVRTVLEHTRAGPLDSKLEGRTWRMLRSSSLAEPVRQLRVDLRARTHYRIDFAWPDLLVAVEAEGFEWHGSRARWKADKIRVAALERQGWRVLVVTWDDVTKRRTETVDRIAMALAERRRLVRSA